MKPMKPMGDAFRDASGEAELASKRDIR